MMGIGRGHLERGVHLNACFSKTKCKVILQEKRNPIYKGEERSYQRKQWLLGAVTDKKNNVIAERANRVHHHINR